MKEITKLIELYCPKGVRYFSLGELEDSGRIILGRGNVISKDEINSCPGPYPVYSSSSLNNGCIGTYGKYMFDDERITWSIDGGGKFFYRSNEKYSVTNVGGWLKVVDKNISTRYLFHVLSYLWRGLTFDYSHKAHPSVIRKEYVLPVPPLEVQNAITAELDNFTGLISMLEREVELRNEEYRHFKTKAFESLSNSKIYHITDLATIKGRVGWQRLTTAEYLQEGDYFLITGTDFMPSGKINFNTCVFVTKERFEMDENIIVHVNDILITKDGTLGKVAFLFDEPSKPTTLNSGVFRIKVTNNIVLPRFLYHFFTSSTFVEFVEKVKTGSTIPHLTQQNLVTLDIPIPSIEKQQTLINQFDAFEDYCINENRGLIKEIELRNKQYLYYADRLLTFKELKS